MLKHYAEFFYPGIIFDESEVREVGSRYHPYAVRLPRGSYGFRYFTRKEVTDEDGNVLRSKPLDVGPMYIYGTRYSLAEAEREFPDLRTLLSNMRTNGFDAVQTCMGNFIAYRDGDVIFDGKPKWEEN